MDGRKSGGHMICPRRSETLVQGHPFKVPSEDEWRQDGTCSWCGSISPDKFFEAIEQGVELGPTDKSYKVYVGKTDHRKFYFQHLSQDERQRFVDLFNASKLTIGYPGRFYTTPFFMRIGPPITSGPRS